MPKVFVTNYNPDFDYKNAEEIGELIYMTHGYVPPAQHVSANRKFAEFAQHATEEDFLLLSGANILTALAVTQWLRIHPSVNVLQHTKRRSNSGNVESFYSSFLLSK